MYSTRRAVRWAYKQILSEASLKVNPCFPTGKLRSSVIHEDYSCTTRNFIMLILIFCTQFNKVNAAAS